MYENVNGKISEAARWQSNQPEEELNTNLSFTAVETT